MQRASFLDSAGSVEKVEELVKMSKSAESNKLAA
jgi:hypothetical protein